MVKLLKLTSFLDSHKGGGLCVGPIFRPGWVEGRRIGFVNDNSRVEDPEELLALENIQLMSWTEEEEKTFLDVWGHNQKVGFGAALLS